MKLKEQVEILAILIVTLILSSVFEYAINIEVFESPLIDFIMIINKIVIFTLIGLLYFKFKK